MQTLAPLLSRYLPGILIGLSGAFVLWTRLIPLANSLSGAEIHSITAYIRPGPPGVWGTYTPNDHPLFELLAWATTAIFRDHSELGYRLWGVGPAIASLALLSWWSWRRLGPWVAAIAAVLGATAPLHMQLSIVARGYGLTYLAAVLSLIAADQLSRAPTRRSIGLFSGAGFLGIISIPTFAFLFYGTAAVLCLRADLRRGVARSVLLTGLACVIFYAAVLPDLITLHQPYRALAFAHPLPWHGFVTHTLGDQLAPSVRLIAPGTSVSVADIVAALALVTGAWLLWRRGARMVAVLTTLPPFFTYAVFEAARLTTAGRFASYVLPALLVPCAFTFAELGRMLARRGTALAWLTCAAAVAFVLLAFHRGDGYFRNTSDVPVENWKAAATFVSDARIRLVVTSAPDRAPLAYYLDHSGRVSAFNRHGLARRFCSRFGPLAYLEDQRQRSATVSTHCLVRRGASAIRLQSVAPLTIWLVGKSWPAMTRR